MFIKYSILTAGCVSILIGTNACSSRYMVESYPTGAAVFVKNIINKERKLVGKTPIKLRNDKQTGDVFFIEFEKDAYAPKKILIKPSDGNVVNLYIKLEPIEDQKKRLQAAKDAISEMQKDLNRKDKDMEKRAEDIRNMARTLDYTENQVKQYREMLFGLRYAKGLANYDRKKSEVIAALMTQANEHIKKKEYNMAENLLRESIAFDEMNPYPYFALGNIMFLKGQKDEAKTYFAKAMELDPNNNEFIDAIQKLK